MEGIQAFTYCRIDEATRSAPSVISEGCVGLRLIAKGIQVYKIDATDYSCRGGDLVVIPPGVSCSTGSHPLYKHSYYHLSVSMNDEEPLLGLDGENARALRTWLRSLPGGRYSSDGVLNDMMKDALRYFSSADSREKQRGRGELLRILLSLEDILENGLPEQMPNVEIAYRYINENITEEFSLSYLAKLSKCSVPYFKEQFASHYGVTPLYYILWRKIAHAKRMIVMEERSVAEIASTLNFATPAYFSSVFKKYTSRTPSEYKRLVERELNKQRHVSDAPKRIVY